MRFRDSKFAAIVGALVFPFLMVSGAAFAQCGISTKLVKPASWNPQLGGVHVLRAALDNDDNRDGPTIVGMWHAVFTAHTMNGQTIPNGGVTIDNSLVTWHSDNTEIMASDRPPQDGQICMGVWQKTGYNKYYLNHIPWLANDTANAPSGIGNPAGPAHLTEWVTLSPDGDHYSGTFTLTAYDVNFHPQVTFSGVLSATRVTTGTSIGELQ